MDGPIRSIRSINRLTCELTTVAKCFPESLLNEVRICQSTTWGNWERLRHRQCHFMSTLLGRSHRMILAGPVVVGIGWRQRATIFRVKLHGLTYDLA